MPYLTHLAHTLIRPKECGLIYQYSYAILFIMLDQSKHNHSIDLYETRRYRPKAVP